MDIQVNIDFFTYLVRDPLHPNGGEHRSGVRYPTFVQAEHLALPGAMFSELRCRPALIFRWKMLHICVDHYLCHANRYILAQKVSNRARLYSHCDLVLLRFLDFRLLLIIQGFLLSDEFIRILFRLPVYRRLTDACIQQGIRRAFFFAPILFCIALISLLIWFAS